MKRGAFALFLIALGAAQAPAGAWTQPRGRLWVKSALIYSFTDRQFAARAAILPGGREVQAGDSRPFDEEGAARARLIWSEVEFGISDRLSVGAALPYQDLRYEDRLALTESWGVGDIRLAARYALLHEGARRLSVRGAWKLPYGEAATRPDDLPLGEGQSDFDLGLQFGRSLGWRSGWTGIEGGYRWRLRNEEIGRDPGDEWFWRVEAAAGLDRAGAFALRVSWDGLRGDATQWDDFVGDGDRRRLQQIGVGLLMRWGVYTLEPSWVLRAAGEAYPAGQEWSFGISRAFDLRRQRL